MKIISRNCTYFRVSEYSRLETLVVKATKKSVIFMSVVIVTPQAKWSKLLNVEPSLEEHKT